MQVSRYREIDSHVFFISWRKLFWHASWFLCSFQKHWRVPKLDSFKYNEDLVRQDVQHVFMVRCARHMFINKYKYYCNFVNTTSQAKRGKIEYITEAVYQINTFIHTSIHIINIYYVILTIVYIETCVVNTRININDARRNEALVTL